FHFGRTYEFAESEVFGSYFVDTQSLHTVDVTCNDCFHQVFGEDVHWEYAVVFVGHNHVTFATLDTGIYHIFLLTHQPAEVRAVDAELIETRHNPTQHFMDFISFGNNGQLAVERAEEAVRRNFLTGQHVAADVAEVFVGSHVTFENVRQQSADFQL